VAAGIPGARFVPLPGKNHIPLETDPAASRNSGRDQGIRAPLATIAEVSCWHIASFYGNAAL
jgi:hypothetical protein